MKALRGLTHPCHPARMAMARWRCWLQDEVAYRRIQICGTLPSGHRRVSDGLVDYCERCGDLR